MSEDFNTFRFGYKGLKDSDELSDDDTGGAEPRRGSSTEVKEDYFKGNEFS